MQGYITGRLLDDDRYILAGLLMQKSTSGINVSNDEKCSVSLCYYCSGIFNHT